MGGGGGGGGLATHIGYISCLLSNIQGKRMIMNVLCLPYSMFGRHQSICRQL